MAKPLEGKVALVTGAARGLGRAIALELAKQGASLAVNYLSSEKDAQETVSLALGHTKASVSIKADVTDPAQVRGMFGKAESELGAPVQVLVNNVGNFLVRNVSDVTPEQWRSLVDSNLNSSFYCSSCALAGMRKSKWGRIVNIGAAGCSNAIAHSNTAPYYAAKTGLLVLTKSLALAEAGNGITVNMVSPGVLETSVAKFEFYPAGREAKFEDITNAIRFLVQPESEYVTGANIEVAGGMML